MMMVMIIIPAAVEKWNRKFDVQLQWKKIFLKCKQTIIETGVSAIMK